MKTKLVIICKHPLIRHALLQRFPLLGIDVVSFERIQEALVQVSTITPDALLIDADGLEQQVGALLKGLRQTGKPIPTIILVSSLSIDQANELVALGVAGIILKPFNPEEHVKRITRFIHHSMRLSLKRRHPRFYPERSQRAVLKYFDRAHRQFVTFSVINVSQGGMLLQPVHPPSLEEFQEFRVGTVIPAADLSLAGRTMRVSLTVVHVGDTVVGVAFGENRAGRRKLTDHLNTLCQNVYGTMKVDWKC